MKCRQGHEMILKAVHTGGYYDAEDYICPICGFTVRLWETGEMQEIGEQNGKKNKEYSN